MPATHPTPQRHPKQQPTQPKPSTMAPSGLTLSLICLLFYRTKSQPKSQPSEPPSTLIRPSRRRSLPNPPRTTSQLDVEAAANPGTEPPNHQRPPTSGRTTHVNIARSSNAIISTPNIRLNNVSSTRRGWHGGLNGCVTRWKYPTNPGTNSRMVTSPIDRAGIRTMVGLPLHNTPNSFELLNTAIVFEQESPDPPQDDDITIAPPTKKTNKQRRKAHIRQTLRELALADSLFLDHSIAQAEDERTVIAKNDTTNKNRTTIDAAHKLQEHHPSIIQQGRNAGYNISTAFRRAAQSIKPSTKRVRFDTKFSTRTFNTNETSALITYDSGADGHYISEHDRIAAGLPILRRSTKRVGVANGGSSTAKHVTQLPFKQLSSKANQADTFEDFPTSLMSVGKISDDGTISIFTKDGVTVHKEQDVLITCKGMPILIGTRDEHGRYRIPLMQQKGQWQPRKPRARINAALQKANSVYDLPSIEQAIKWMHAVCGYPVKSTWLKAVKAGNFTGWPLLTEKNVQKYYPETTETDKGHMNQTRKNVRSTKPKSTPFEDPNTAQLRGKKVHDIFTKVYDPRETIFSDQTGKFPTQSQRGNKYIMVMVEIDSNAILVEPMNSKKDKEMIRAYDALVLRLKRAGVVPKKHVLDNEVSEAMKNHIRDDLKFTMELVPPGCHRRNAAEVAIRNFKSHFLSVLAGTADNFPPSLWDRLMPQTEVTLNLLRQSNATPTVSAYAHLSGPFDYNKMPLAPMGSEVQVHEKTDKRGTWAFHSLDGWYLNTSPEHYRVHNCHIKSTRAERLSDTVQIKHKHITNPTLSHSDKLMNALANCKAALMGKINNESDHSLEELKSIVQQVESKLHNQPEISTTKEPAVPRVETIQPTPRVDSVPTPVPRVPIALTPTIQQNTPNPLPILARRAAQQRTAVRRRRLQDKPPQVHLPTQPPALSTRSKVIAATTAPPASRTRNKSRLMQPTSSSKNKQRQANAIHEVHSKKAKVKRAVQKLEKQIAQAMAVLDEDTGNLLNYRQLLRHPKYKAQWKVSSANEFGRLANGVGGRIKKPTNTIRFIREQDVPKDRRKDITYGSFTCSVRPEKIDEPNRTRFTAGGDKINYPGEVATPTAEMLVLVAKLLFNSVVSTPGAKFMTMDISNFYLMTPLLRPEYLRIKMADLPDEIIQEYRLRKLVNAKGFVFVEVTKGMYGLPQAGLLANELLEKRLNKEGYFQSKLVAGLWAHKTRPIQFTLVVDDFGVKYVGQEHANHLLKTLEKHYKVTADWTGNRYIGIHLLWDYDKRQVHLRMPDYVKNALKQFHHKLRKRQHQPFPHTPIEYGAKQQFAKESSKSPKLDAKGKKFVQQVCGKFLFLGRAVDSTLLAPISAIASQSSEPTEETLEHVKQFLDYILPHRKKQ
eukprot:scaffold29109_cov56-Cyclotella_meneghiniana.AAC.5